MIPHFEPTTGLESFCTLDKFIQQHIKAASGDPSPKEAFLQSEVDRLRDELNRVMVDRHTLHGQYTDLVRSHNEARMKSEKDAAELAKVTAELNDSKTIKTLPGAIATLQAERHGKDELIKRLQKRVVEAEAAAKVERDLRQLAENTAAQKTRASEGLQQTMNRLSIRVSALEKECDVHKNLKYDLAVAKSHLKTANLEATRLREAQSGIMARSDEMRTKNDGLTERVAELEAEALLPMPSNLAGLPVATDKATPLIDVPLPVTLLRNALEQTRSDLKQAHADNAELKSKNAVLETEAARFKVELVVRRTQLQDSQKAQALAENEVTELRTKNQKLLDQIRDLKELVSKYEAQIELPLPSQLGTPNPTVEHQHSVIGCDLRLEIAKYKSELGEVRAELKQALADLEEARFPWYGMVLEAEAEGQEGERKKEAVAIVKARIHDLETAITELQSTNGALQLQLDDISAKAELKRLKDLALKNARETTKLQILHAGSAGVIDVTTPSPPASSPIADSSSPALNDDKMEVEVEVEGDCSCGREAVIVEMASRSEVVFEQTLNLLENVKTAARTKLDDSPLKDRGQRVRSVEVLTKYLEKVAGLVEHAREGVANRL